MDKATLVNRLKQVFHEKRSEGLVVDAIGLASAYHGLVQNRYTLGVSAPSLVEMDKYDKMDLIIDILFECLSQEERAFIDRVRVFDNIDELDYYKINDFEEYEYEGYNGSTRRLPDLYAVE